MLYYFVKVKRSEKQGGRACFSPRRTGLIQATNYKIQAKISERVGGVEGYVVVRFDMNE
jgi:hypothetical protein